jgi:hypothetical protein
MVVMCSFVCIFIFTHTQYTSVLPNMWLMLQGARARAERVLSELLLAVNFQFPRKL